MRDISEILSYIDSQYDLENSAKVVLDGNKVLSMDGVPGIKVKTKERKNGVDIKVVVEKGITIENPVHMCFAILDQKLVQKLNIDFTAEKNSHVTVIAHCIFPDVDRVKHVMDGDIKIKEGAYLEYIERHIHDEKGNLNVSPYARINLAKNSTFKTSMEVLEGRAGNFNLDYFAKASENCVIEMKAKVNGYGTDKIKITEGAELAGKNARAIVLSKVAARDKAVAEVYNTVIATAENTRGHVDCTEIIVGDGIVKAYPIIEARHPKARVTHEASLGGVDKKQLETLMARGLSEKEATELIIKSLLNS